MGREQWRRNLIKISALSLWPPRCALLKARAMLGRLLLSLACLRTTRRLITSLTELCSSLSACVACCFLVLIRFPSQVCAAQNTCGLCWGQSDDQPRDVLVCPLRLPAAVCALSPHLTPIFWPLHSAFGILISQPGVQPTSSALEGGFLTTEAQGKSLVLIFIKSCGCPTGQKAFIS